MLLLLFTDAGGETMATLSLRIHIVDGGVTKTMQFDPSTTVDETCSTIRDKILEAGRGQPKDYGLFLADEDAKKGVWLEPGRSLEYYILRNNDLLEYRKKLRTLKVQMLDGTVKTIMIDDSQPVANLMVVICTKLGITNHDEYGLIRENIEDEIDSKAPNSGTLTLRRKREEKERDAKMDQLRKKLKTDDELNWIDPSKTLREQGINEGEPVLLRRKFFFSDGNIDSHDPVQLNLLYVQARDAILDGTHPVTEELACKLAGLQVHIQFGNHNEAKHKPPFLDLKEFLPNSYVKVRNIEKKIFTEHKRHYGLTELDAKVEYTKTCRSLPTYGVTFFLVKEKMKGKNKLVPRLLGVNKDSVLRLDERSKEILKTWPLTTVRQWAASPNTFTLDFGDYSDDYYSVQTKEAEQIQQIIAGYIDIILKRQQAKDHFGIEGDEGSTMIEEMVSPSKASILQHESNRVGKVNAESVAKPAVIRAGIEGSKPYGMGHVGSAQYTTVSGQINVGHSPVVLQQSHVTNVVSGPQKALVSTIGTSQETIKTVEAELMSKVVIPDSASSTWKESTMSCSKQHVSSHIAAMNAATAQIITMTSGEMDYMGVEEAIHSITTNLPEMSENVRMIAALSPSGDQLLDAARKLCTAFTDLLNAVQPQSNTSRQTLLNAASRVGEASRRMITEISENKDESKDMLLSLAKAVANTTAVLVIKAKSVAATVDQPQQAAVISAATKCALATSQLVACTKVVASTVENPSCREQLVMAAKEVMNAMEDLVSVCGLSVPEDNNILLKDLIAAVAEVTSSLNRLISQVKTTKPVNLLNSVTQKEEIITNNIVEHYEPSPMTNGHTSEVELLVEEKQSVPQSPPVKYYTATVSKVIYNISQAMHRVSDTEYSKTYESTTSNTESNYEYHTRMVNTSKDIAKVTQEMMTKPWSDDNKYDASLSQSYSQLSSDCINFVASEPNPETSERLSSNVRDLGSACINAIKVAASTSTNNSYACRERTEKAKDVAEKVSQVLSALQACSRGTQACNNAASTVSGIIGDLDTIIMFATAGTLHAEKENETFADHRENILKTAKALVEDTKTLVAGAASSQEQLAVAAQNAVSTITQLAEVVKYGAASLGSDNPESQVMLINAVKDVANALGDLIQATKCASGKGINDPSMAYLKESARVMVTNLTSLLKTVKVVEDEHSRGTRALESTIEAIAQEMRALTSPSLYNTSATPEELIRSTKAITLATAKAVAAGNSCKQEDVIIAANMGRKAISDMLSICKSCMNNAETSDLRERALQAGKETASQYRELLQVILNILRPNQTVTDPKQTLPQISRSIAQSVTELVSVAEALKGKDWVHPDDPTMIAENELLGAAASIDAAARKLASLKPRKCVQETNESLNFNEMILEAAKSIAAATSALIKAASAAQRELVDTGKVSRTPLTSSDDGQWSEGLISAARLVAAATHSLVESANALVQGIASEERLISAARQVASSTAQLLVACKVKADPDSDTTKRLQAAGNAVKRATDNLVRAAQQAIQHDEERSLILNKRMVGGIAQEINARSEVLRIERELEEARNRLTAIRQAKYKLRSDGTVYEDESDAAVDSFTA